MIRTLAFLLLAAAAWAEPHGGELRFCVRAEPRTFHPQKVADDAGETVRYLTGGVLLRLDRVTQKVEPALARAYKVSGGGRVIEFTLRSGLRFSDGTPFTSADVAYTMKSLMDPAMRSPTADPFRSAPGDLRIETPAPDRIRIEFPAPVAGLDRLFDQVAMLSAASPLKEKAVLGPFVLAEYKPGVEMLFQRNPHYWKTDAAGRRLPYLNALRIFIQGNREVEAMRFRKGDLHLLNTVDPEIFQALEKEMPGSVRDAGPSLDTDMIFFNQVPAAPLPEYKKAWFRSREFRRAVSEAINREDIVRLAYLGHAVPAASSVSPTNRFFAVPGLKPHAHDPAGARKRLERAGFRVSAGALRDPSGNPVEFSLVTNSGNKARARIAALVQEDLKRIGIQLNVVTLDMPSLIGRITESFRYEACLIALVNVDLDPNAQMNVYLSSGASHQWNPSQAKPATPWEAEIDRLMRLQASSADPTKRRDAFAQVQRIALEESPLIFLVHRGALAAVSPALRNARPSVLRPQMLWNVEHLALGGETLSQLR